MNILNKVNSSNDIKTSFLSFAPSFASLLLKTFPKQEDILHPISALSSLPLRCTEFMTARWTESCSMSAIRAMLTK